MKINSLYVNLNSVNKNKYNKPVKSHNTPNFTGATKKIVDKYLCSRSESYPCASGSSGGSTWVNDREYRLEGCDKGYRVNGRIENPSASRIVDNGTWRSLAHKYEDFCLIKNHPLYHKNSLIVESNGDLNSVYFADPEEVVSSDVLKQHFAIVYDNKPDFPDFDKVKNTYLNTNENAHNLGEDFKEVGEYYERLKKADQKELSKLLKEKEKFQPKYNISLEHRDRINKEIEKFPWATDEYAKEKEIADYFFDENAKIYTELNNKILYYQARIAESDKQQKIAFNGYRLFDEVGLILLDRDKARNTKNYFIKDIELKENGVKLSNENIQKLSTEFAKQEESLKCLLTLKNSENTTKEEINFYNKKIEKTQADIKKLQEEISRLKKCIENDTNAISDMKSKLPELETRFEQKSKEAAGLFYKMQDFYALL